MNNQQRKTLETIFAIPVPMNLEWSKIERLLVAIGAEIIEGSGSRVAFKLRGARADFHRPHPGKEAKPYQIRAVREFLEQIGVVP